MMMLDYKGGREGSEIWEKSDYVIREWSLCYIDVSAILVQPCFPKTRTQPH